MGENTEITGQEGTGEGTQEVISENITQEELAAQFNAAVEGEGSGTQAGEQGGEGSGEGNGNPENEFKIPLEAEELNVYKEVLGDVLNEDFFKNEDGTSLNKKDSIKKINEYVKASGKNEILNDPFISMYLKEKTKEGFNQRDFIKSLSDKNNIDNIPNKEFLSDYYKKQNYSEEEIQKFLESKTSIELDEIAIRAKEDLKNSFEKDRQENYNKFVQEKEKELNAKNEIVSNHINEYFEKTLVGGKFPIKFAESDLGKIREKMLEMTKIKLVDYKGQKYETSGIDMFFRDADKLLKVLPFIALEDLGILDENVHNAFNRVKDREFEKIDGSNALGKGGKPSVGTNWSKFMGNS